MPYQAVHRGPYAVTVDGAGIVWANEFATDTIVRLDPQTGQMRPLPLPSKGIGIRKMIVDAEGRLWYMGSQTVAWVFLNEARGSLSMGWKVGVYGVVLGGLVFGTAQARELPIFDAHLRYSRPDWQVFTPKRILAILDQAGVQRALLSNTPDDGTLQLYAQPRSTLSLSYAPTAPGKTWGVGPVIRQCKPMWRNG